MDDSETTKEEGRKEGRKEVKDSIELKAEGIKTSC